VGGTGIWVGSSLYPTHLKPHSLWSVVQTPDTGTGFHLYSHSMSQDRVRLGTAALCRARVQRFQMLGIGSCGMGGALVNRGQRGWSVLVPVAVAVGARHQRSPGPPVDALRVESSNDAVSSGSGWGGLTKIKEEKSRGERTPLCGPVGRRGEQDLASVSGILAFVSLSARFIY